MNLYTSIPFLSCIVAVLTSVALADDFPVSAGTTNELVVFTVTNAARANFDFYRNSIAGLSGAKTGCGQSMTSQAPLEWSMALQGTAVQHTTDMVKNGCFSHDSCNCSGYECSFFSRVSKNYGEAYAAENIAEGGLDDDMVTLVDRWMESPAHCNNILGPKSRQIGISVQDKATQDFGGLGGAPMNKLLSGVFVKDRFLAIMSSGSTVTPNVVIGSNSFPMQNTNNGVYHLPQAVGNCVQYFFQSNGQRFPSTGVLIANCGKSVFSGDGVVLASVPAPALAPASPASPPVPSPVFVTPPASTTPLVSTPSVVSPSVVFASVVSSPVVFIATVFPAPATSPSPVPAPVSPPVNVSEIPPLVRALLLTTPTTTTPTSIPSFVVIAPTSTKAAAPVTTTVAAAPAAAAVVSKKETSTVTVNQKPTSSPSPVNNSSMAAPMATPQYQPGNINRDTMDSTGPDAAFNSKNLEIESRKVGTRFAYIGVPVVAVCGILVAALILRRRQKRRQLDSQFQNDQSPQDRNIETGSMEGITIDSIPPSLRKQRPSLAQLYPFPEYVDQPRTSYSGSFVIEYGDTILNEEQGGTLFQPHPAYRTSGESVHTTDSMTEGAKH